MCCANEESSLMRERFNANEGDGNERKVWRGFVREKGRRGLWSADEQIEITVMMCDEREARWKGSESERENLILINFKSSNTREELGIYSNPCSLRAKLGKVKIQKEDYVKEDSIKESFYISMFCMLN
ncbi:hypothetical protein LR48_Vigan09g060900 [Vigna angularis]|uniref:Uncharacterized protein n=1 Tax=Phaseolus angularis TaxID=3914 RepID=A0A0L9VA74_PHAAN|nr:hypothetical protein LR48_Vigan09g060900 [Vigna angularis]